MYLSASKATATQPIPARRTHEDCEPLRRFRGGEAKQRDPLLLVGHTGHSLSGVGATSHASEALAMKIRPLQDRVIVRRVKEEEKTKGGLYIPDSAKEKPVEAMVIAVGSGKVLEDGSVRKLDIKEGDRILFGKYSGSEVKIDGEDHLILREDDILGVLEG